MPLVQGHEGEIAGNEHQAGDPRADGRRGEPAIGLQQPVENDREPVQQGLGSKHLQHVAGNGDHVGVGAVRVRVAGVQQRGDRPGGRHYDQAQRYHDDNGPGQQRRGDLADPRLLRRVMGRPLGRASQHRDHRAGQRAAQDQLVQEIGHLVRGDVRRAQAARADGLREHQCADQAQYPGQYRKAGDDDGAAGDALGQPRSWLRLRQASLRAGLHMQLPIALHARPPSGYAPVGPQDPDSAGIYRRQTRSWIRGVRSRRKNTRKGESPDLYLSRKESSLHI